MERGKNAAAGTEEDVALELQLGHEVELEPLRGKLPGMEEELLLEPEEELDVKLELKEALLLELERDVAREQLGVLAGSAACIETR